PGRPVLGIVLAHGPPLPLREVGAPALPVRGARARLVETRGLPGRSRLPSSTTAAHPRSLLVVVKPRRVVYFSASLGTGSETSRITSRLLAPRTTSPQE